MPIPLSKLVSYDLTETFLQHSQRRGKEKPGLSRWRRILFLSAVAVSFSAVFADREAQGDRIGGSEPIVIEGEYLEEFLGIPCNAIALYRLQDRRILALPFQIDRRVCDSDGTEESCAYLVDGDTDRLGTSAEPLGSKDELVFLASACGECFDSGDGNRSGDALPENFPEGMLEIRIEDPSTKTQACVYLGGKEADGDAEWVPEVSYDHSLDVVTSSKYRVAFDPENPYFWKTISLSGETGRIPLFTKEGILSQVSHLSGTVRYEVTDGDIRSRLVGHRAGPVRVIRVTRNRLRIGPLLWKATLETGVFYRDRFHTSFHTGTYLHHRFLVEEKQRLFTNLAAAAAGLEWQGEDGQMQGLVDSRVSPEEQTVHLDELQTLFLAGEDGSVLYQVCPHIPGKLDQPLLCQPYLQEGDETFASAGMCFANLQDTFGPRHRFVKSLFFFPSNRTDLAAASSASRPGPIRIWAGSREIPQPVHPPCGDEPENEREEELREACLRKEPRKGSDRRWGVVPSISAGPDKGLGFGVKYRDLGLLSGNQPLEARFLYTIYQYTIAECRYFVNAFPTHKSGLRLSCNYYNKTRARFYGIGNNTDEADVADFGWQDLVLSLALDHKLPHNFGLLVGWGARWGNIGEGKDSDLPNLEDVYPNLSGVQGGWGNGPLLGVYHSTLSPPGDPHSGGMQSLTVTFADGSMGTFTYQQYKVEAIQIIPLPGYAHRLALRAQFQLMGGSPPFYLVSWVGGDDTARGYYEGRYRDLDRILLNMEYRCNLYKFLDGVLFLDTGKVAADLLHASLFRGIHVTGGVGFRIHLYPDLIARVDVGISSEMTGVYFNFGHAF